MNPDENPRRWPWRPLLWTLGILCAAYLPLFFGKILFFRDIAHWNFPARAFLRDALVRGELPGWNPYQGLGFPVFADPLYGVFYPPNWLFALVGPGWVASMLNWQCFLHMAWGAAGVCWLARRLGGSPKATIIAGLAWGLSGFTTAEWTSGLRLLADAWIPWAAVGQVALLDSLRAGGSAWRRGLVKAALPSVFAVLLGEVFLAMIGAGFGVLFACVLHGVERRSDPSLPRAHLRWLVAAALAVVLAFAAGAVVIVPARMLLGSTERAGRLSRWVAEVCSLHPLRMVEFALPQSMGDPDGIFPAASIVGEPRLDGMPLSYSMYLGASVIALALAAFGRGRRMALALGGLAGFALLLALGRHTPVHAVFRRIVFPLAYMRYPEKYTVLLVAMVSLLAGMGAKRILSNGAQPWRRTSVLLALIIALGIMSCFVLPPAWLVFAIHGALLGSLATLGILAVHFLAARASALAPLLLVAVVAFDLAAAVWPLQGFGPRRIASELPLAARLALERRSDAQAPPRLYRSNQTTQAVNKWVPANSNAEGEFRLVSTLVTNTVNAWGIATLPGYDAAIPALVQSVWNAGLAEGLSAARLLAADYAVLPVADPAAAKDDRPGLEPLMDPLPGARLYRVPLALPRVFLARHAEVLPDDRALRRIYEPEVVAGKTVWLAPDSEATASLSSTPPGRAGTCALESYRNNRLVALCTALERGLAVFVEQYDRRWQATVDDRPARVLRANLIMRALPLEAGTHRIVLEFRTPGLGIGAVISVVSLLLLGVLWLGGDRRKNGGRSGRSGLKALLGLTVVILLLTQLLASSPAKSRSRHEHSPSMPTDLQSGQAPSSGVRDDAVFVFVKGIGILRLQGGTVAPVLRTQASIRDMQLDSEGALWASLDGVGVVRHSDGKTVNLNQESFAKLALRSPTDVWTINDSHGNVVHYDGNRWKTVRTRNSLGGAFDDNRLLDIVTDGRVVWVSGWNGLWRMSGGRWTRLEPPVVPSTSDDAEADVASTPAYPLSLRVSRAGLIACYLSGCFVSVESGWRPSHWPAGKAQLQSAGATNLVAGTDADGRTVVIARLDGSGKTSRSEPLPATGINDIAIDTTGRIWVATGAALTILDAGGHTIQQWDIAGKVGDVEGQPVEIERMVVAGTGPKQLPAD